LILSAQKKKWRPKTRKNIYIVRIEIETITLILILS